MESRRIVYYQGNTIKPRGISNSSVRKRLEVGAGNEIVANHIPPYFDKVYATKNCVWCHQDFEHFRIVCNHCTNCQYCGLTSVDPNWCHLCGNKAPDDIMVSRDRERKRIF